MVGSLQRTQRKRRPADRILSPPRERLKGGFLIDWPGNQMTLNIPNTSQFWRNPWDQGNWMYGW